MNHSTWCLRIQKNFIKPFSIKLLNTVIIHWSDWSGANHIEKASNTLHHFYKICLSKLHIIIRFEMLTDLKSPDAKELLSRSLCSKTNTCCWVHSLHFVIWEVATSSFHFKCFTTSLTANPRLNFSKLINFLLYSNQFVSAASPFYKFQRYQV